MNGTSRFAAAVVLVLACACGGGGGSGGEGSPLDAGFAGRWVGTTSMSLTGADTKSHAGELEVTVSGDTATIANICLDGSMSTVVTGSGSSASWDGELTCPAMPATGCSSPVIVTYQHATATLAGDELTLTATGTASGCGSSSPITVTFRGTK